MPGLQEWIHKLEEGEGVRHVKSGTFLLGLLFLMTIYNWSEYRNFSAPEAMDQAQVARQLTQGRGFSTGFIRPLSLHLLLTQREDKKSFLKENHPDLANAPVYPLLLAGLMNVLPFQFAILDPRDFRKYQPEVLIAWFNQALFFAAVFLLFLLTRQLFDASAAWVAALVLVGTELFWRFSVSGLSTLMLILIFLGIVWCLIRIERSTPEPAPVDTGAEPLLLDQIAPPPAAPQPSLSRNQRIGFAAAAGLLVGLGGMTRYSFAWLILPVVAFLLLFFPGHRKPFTVAAVLAFALTMAPWLVRNYQVSGNWFGTAAYAVYQETKGFEANRLERSLHPDFGNVSVRALTSKLIENSRDLLLNHLPRLGGNWVSAFFLVGLLVPFRSSTLTRLRVFLLLSLAVLVVVQALGRTHLSTDTPEVNSENLLVIVAPLVVMFGVGLFFTLLDPLALSIPQMRWVKGAFIALASAPLLLSLLPPKTFPIAYPPYYPPAIQEPSSWMQEDEMMMSDMPWAISWYGQRRCLWLTLNSPLDSKNDFFAINDFQKTIQAIYLTPVTMDGPFLTRMYKNDDDWGKFILKCMLAGRVPPEFPLQKMPAGFLPEQLFLTDRERGK